MTRYRIVTVHEVTRKVRRSSEIESETVTDLAAHIIQTHGLYSREEAFPTALDDVDSFGGQRTETFDVRLVEAVITDVALTEALETDDQYHKAKEN